MRFKVWTKAQHPYNHQAADIAYTHAALPGVTSGQNVWDWIVAVLYPQDLPAVANIAALPAGGNTLGDYRVVNDTGAGKAGGFRWEQREGDAAPKWYQIYAMNWGFDSVMSGFLNQTQNIYVNKYGYDDTDSSGVAVAGTQAGQTVYGGRTSGKNLTLYPNAGDGAGAVTGFIQVAGTTRPIGTTNTLDLGTSSNKFRTGYFGTSVLAGTMTLSGGTIADSSGAVSFGALNVSTSGTWTAGSYAVGFGSAAAPSYSFTGDTTTGFFRQAAGAVSFSSAGAEAWRLTAGSELGPQGTVGAPSRAFLLDAATGVYQPAVSQWAVATAATRRILVDANGNVTFGTTTAYVDAQNGRLGVGTASPSVDLHVVRASSPQFRLDSQNSTGTSPGEIQFFAARAANANLAALDDMGYVDWYGRVSGASTWLAGIQGRYRGSGTTSFADIIFATSNGGAPGERMRIRYDGNVGIGVSDPLYPLHVSGAAYVANFLASTNSITAQNAGGGIALVTNGTGRVSATVGLDPSANASVDLGQTGTRWQNLYMSGSLGDGTNTIAIATLLSLRGILTGVASGNGIFYNGTQWVAADPDTEVFHDAISHLTSGGTDGDAGHSQFVVAAGRAAAQTIKGGTAASANLTLYSTAHATLGQILMHSDTCSDGDGTYSLGAAGKQWLNFYLKGQMIGARVENYTTAGAPAASASTPGRMYWDTTVKAQYIDNGGTWIKNGTLTYYTQDAVGWTGSVASVTYDVSSVFSAGYPAYKALWQFQDNSNNRQILQGALISFPSATQVTVAFDNNLAAGTYSLVGVG